MNSEARSIDCEVDACNSRLDFYLKNEELLLAKIKVVEMDDEGLLRNGRRKRQKVKKDKLTICAAALHFALATS